MNQEIVVLETLQTLPGKAKALKAALREIVPHSRKEMGCLQYDLLEPAEGEEEFLVVMRWTSKENLQAHENSSHIQEFVRKYDGVLYGKVSLSTWKIVG